MRPVVILILVAGWVVDARSQDEGRIFSGGLEHVDRFGALAPQPYRLKPFVVPGSVSVRTADAALDSSRITVDYRFGLLQVDLGGLTADSLTVRYRAFPIEFRDVYRIGALAANPDSTSRDSRTPSRPPDSNPSRTPFSGSRLLTRGSVTRGVIAGNRQDATIESGLRMQLNGEILDGVNLRAVLTDENTPILPEGTTQRLSEIDRVFIEVSSARGAAQLGDFDFVMAASEFAQFNRKLQGAKVRGTIPGTGRWFSGGEVVAAGATSRGTFRSQSIQGLDGVQGPYRLEGSGGERFIVVVPGTEQVYIDGRRMQRGESNDYVIDYATAEIMFTARRIITSNKRIIVEFQYSTNQFTRTLVGTSVKSRFGHEQGTSAYLSASFLREADSDEFSQEFGLTSADSSLLVSSGDRPASSSGAERVDYDPEAPFVQYTRVPFIRGDGTVDTVFAVVASAPAEGTQVFRVRFSRVGSAKGSYVRTGRSVNGILYEYRGPGAGEYEPVRILPKPKRQQLFDLSGGLSPFNGLEVFGTWARSINDENRLSSADSGDDEGFAYTIGGRVRDLSTGFWGSRVRIEARRRRISSDFRSFNRIRPVEFGRRWGVDLRSVGVTGGNGFGTSETTSELTGAVSFGEESSLAAEWSAIKFGQLFDAGRQSVTLRVEERQVPVVDYQLERIVSQDEVSGESGNWLRQTAALRYTNVVARLSPALELEHEDRRQRVDAVDSLTAASLAFVELRPSLTWQDDRLEAGAAVDWRKERFVDMGRLQNATTGWTVRGFLRYRAGRLFTTDANAGLRKRRFTKTFSALQAGQNTESVVLRWNGTHRPWAGAITTSWLYEAQTERTPKMQEIYVRTGLEFGQFVWTDTNGDGVIQLEEFVPETTPTEGTYVRTFVPSDTLFSVIGVQARLRVALDPQRKWKGSEAPWKRWLSLVSTRTTLEVVERSQEQDLKKVYLLDLGSFRRPGTTINGRLAVRQEVSLFKGRPDVGVDVSFNEIRSLSDLAAGLEERFVRGWRLSGRVRAFRRVTMKVTGSTEISRVESESFASRRYNLKTDRLVPSVTFSASRAVQFKAGVDLARKVDRLVDRRSTVVKSPVEIRLNKARRFQFTGRIELARVDLAGEATGIAQFELTDGRGTGTSWLWSAGAQYAINRYIRANLSYDGRAPAEAPTLHTLRMQVSAVF